MNWRIIKEIANFFKYSKASAGKLSKQIYIGMEIDHIEKSINNKIIRIMPNLLIRNNKGFIPYSKNYENDYLDFIPYDIAKIMGVEIEIIADEQRFRPEKSEVERLWASNEKAGALLGWQPKYGGNEGFHRGLEETVAWFCKASHFKFYKPEIYNL